MVLYTHREKFLGFTVKVGIIFSKLGLSPNQWTLLSLVPTFIALYFLIKEAFLQAAILFIFASFIDIVDGSVAKVTGRVTKFGGYLDNVIDRYVEGIIIFGLLFASLPNLVLSGFTIPVTALIFIYLFGGMMTTYAKASAKERDIVEKELKGGLLQRAERLLILFVGILLAIYNPLYLTYVIAILAVLTNITAIQRIFIAFRLSKENKN